VIPARVRRCRILRRASPRGAIPILASRRAGIPRPLHRRPESALRRSKTRRRRDSHPRSPGWSRGPAALGARRNIVP